MLKLEVIQITFSIRIMDKILDGKKLAERLNSALKDKIDTLYPSIGFKPRLGVILVGENPASEIYVNIKLRTGNQVGIESKLVRLNETISKHELLNEISKLNEDETIHGIILQLPLPDHLQGDVPEFLEHITPAKDIEGLHPINKGKLFDYDEEFVPCTAKGIIKLIEFYGIEIAGKEVVIINRSNLVGKPLIFLFLKRNATVTVCHTSTKDIDFHIKRADILVVAVGRPNFITKERIKHDVIIVDVGTNRVDGKLCGDVNFDDVYEKVRYITPVPGGVGPLTVATLLDNTFLAYEKQFAGNQD